MSRQFSKNLANYMSLFNGAQQQDNIGALINGAAAVTMVAWVNYTSLGTIALGDRPFSFPITSGSTGLALAVDGTATPKVLRCFGRSEGLDGGDGFNATTAMPTGQWTHVGGVFDFQHTSIQPYMNGIAEGGGTPTWAGFTYLDGVPTNAGGDSIGSNCQNGAPPINTGSQVDGLVAEVAVWTTDIGSANFALLAAGWPPGYVGTTTVRNALVFYMPLYGNVSPEPALVSPLTGNITGSVPQGATHPNMLGYIPCQPDVDLPAYYRRLVPVPSGSGPQKMA